MLDGAWEEGGLHLLVADGDPEARMRATARLGGLGTAVRVTATGRLDRALRVLRAGPVSCVVTELRLGDARGPGVVRALRAAGPEVPVVVCTGHGSEELAAAALRLGASAYLAKRGAWDVRLGSVVREALGRAVLAGLADGAPLPLAPVRRFGGQEVVAVAPATRRLLALVERATASSVPVLLEGETGTGKEVLARAIHARSPNRDAPFVAQNCGALAETLLESELFGHVRGAFTGAERDRQGLFAAAGAGTVLLDEIGDAPPGVQVQLLRVLQAGEVKPVGADRPRPVRVRIVAATNRPLLDDVRAGRFRADLYFRLAVFPVVVPPLRRRAADVPVLLEHFRRRFARAEGRAVGGFARDALAALVRHPWPGNVRELEHEVHRLVLTVPEGESIRAAHLASRIRGAAGPGLHEPLDAILARVELAVIRERLDALPSKAAAARSLGITREGLYGKLRRLEAAAAGLSSPEQPRRDAP